MRIKKNTSIWNILINLIIIYNKNYIVDFNGLEMYCNLVYTLRYTYT